MLISQLSITEDFKRSTIRITNKCFHERKHNPKRSTKDTLMRVYVWVKDIETERAIKRREKRRKRERKRDREREREGESHTQKQTDIK